MDIVRSEQEIARVENWAFAALDEGTHFAGMTYEQGLIDMLEWLRGDTNNAPDEEGIRVERVRRITGYLVGSVERFNNAKRAEVADRVKHVGMTGWKE